MSIKFRRFLYILFILVFLVVVPLLMLYASGYKVSLGNIVRGDFFIQKTGILVIDSSPENARVYINGEPREFFFKNLFNSGNDSATTPAKIKNLLPGDYIVRLEKNGYWPWEKRLTIEPGVATYAEDIYLFRNNLPTQALQAGVNELSFSPNREMLAFFNNEGLFIFDLATENQTKIMDTPEKLVSTSTGMQSESLSWSKNGERLLFDDHLISVKRDFAVIDEDNSKIIDGSNLKWDLANDNILYYQNGNALYSLDLTNHSTSTVLNLQPFTDYLVKGDFVHLLRQLGNSTNILTYNRQSQLQSSISLPLSTEYTFINQEHALLNLYDRRFEILYLLNPFQEINPLQDALNNINYTQWIDSNRLLYANELEIWIYNLDKNSKTLLTRISEGITGVAWHPSDNYVIYSTQKSINVLELDDRENRIITRLANINDIRWLHIEPRGETLYFYAQIGNQEGVYKLNIQ